MTQFYVAGEPLNERDGLFNELRDPRQRDALLLRPSQRTASSPAPCWWRATSSSADPLKPS